MSDVVDISNYQTPQLINWDQLGKVCDGAILNCEMTPANYEVSMKGCVSHEIPVGLYFNSDRVAGVDYFARGKFMGGLARRLELLNCALMINWFAVDSDLAAYNFDRTFSDFEKGYKSAGATTPLGVYCGFYLFENYKLNVKNISYLWLAYYNGSKTRSKYNEIMRQYSGSGRIAGIPGIVDLNTVFDQKVFVKKGNDQPVEVLALQVLQGMHGNGDARRLALGLKYDQVQEFVNRCFELAVETRRGVYGNGDIRIKKLGKYYECVQFLINNNMI